MLNRFSNLGIWQRDWELPGNLTPRAVGFITALAQDWGNRLLEGTNKTLYAQDPGERSSDPTRDWARLAWVFRSLRWRRGSIVACWGVRDAEYNSPGSHRVCWHTSFWGRSLLPPLPLPQFGLRPNYREGTQPHPSRENWIKDLLSLALSIRARQIPSHQEASTSLLSLSIRGETEWKVQSQKTIKLVTWITALPNSVKLWARPCRATQDGLWCRVVTKHGPLEKGMKNNFRILPVLWPLLSFPNLLAC